MDLPHSEIVGDSLEQGAGKLSEDVLITPSDQTDCLPIFEVLYEELDLFNVELGVDVKERLVFDETLSAESLHDVVISSSLDCKPGTFS
jgi:hypothetical protein